MGTYWTELILEAVWYKLFSHITLRAYDERWNAWFCSTLDYLWTFFRANHFQKAWTCMCSATGQSRAAGLLTSRVPVLFSCLTGKHLWLKSHLVCSYQKKLRSFTEQAWKLLISPLCSQEHLLGGCWDCLKWFKKIICETEKETN